MAAVAAARIESIFQIMPWDFYFSSTHVPPVGTPRRPHQNHIRPNIKFFRYDKLHRLAAEFDSLEPIDRVKKLLHYSTLLQPLDESSKIVSNRVMGCTSQVWLVAELDDCGKMRFKADSDSEISRGFCSCLVSILDGADPEEVLSFKTEDLAPLSFASLQNSRVNTWHNVLISMHKRTKALLAQAQGNNNFGDLFPSLVVTRHGVQAKGTYAEAQDFCGIDIGWLSIRRACTQRVEPRLALVEAELPSEAFSIGWKPTKNSYLVIRAPGMDELKVSLSKPCEKSEGVTVWEWTGSVLDEGAEASKWFSDFIGKPSHLVRYNDEADSRPLPDYAPTPGYNLVFTDKYQFMLLSQGSLDALNNQLEEPLPVNRFRPSILIDGCEPFAEDLWKEIKMNNLTFLSIKHPVMRPLQDLVNQENGIPGSELNETLMKFRSDKILQVNTRQKGKAYFGQGLVCSKDSLNGVGEMILKVGDTIHVEKMVASYADVIV